MSGKSTSIFALIVAAIVLLIVGAMSYHEYLMAKLEREYGVRPAGDESLQAMGGGDGTPAAGAPIPSPGAGSQIYGDPAGGGGYPPAGQGANGNLGGTRVPGAPGGMAANPGGVPGYVPGRSSVPGAAATSDPEIAMIREELAALKEENRLYQQRLESLQSDKGAGAGPRFGAGAAAGGVSDPREVAGRSGMPPGIQGGLPANPSPVDPSAGGLIPAASSQESDEMDALRKMIRTAPAIAKVVHFDTEWSYIEIDGGKDRNIAEGDKFAVRRGFEIVGYVRVAEVFEKGAVADLTSANKHSQTARKPKAGDELIKFDLIENVSPAG